MYTFEKAGHRETMADYFISLEDQHHEEHHEEHHEDHEEWLAMPLVTGNRRWYYSGPRGNERKVKVVWQCKTTMFYDGPRNEERCYCIERFGKPGYARREFYEGPRGHEHKVKAVWHLMGFQQWFEGASGKERLVRSETHDGFIAFYEGPPDNPCNVLCRPRRTPAYLWALMRRMARHIALAWFWFGLAGAPGGKAHAKAVGEWADMCPLPL
jgi:hypothetical protein